MELASQKVEGLMFRCNIKRGLEKIIGYSDLDEVRGCNLSIRKILLSCKECFCFAFSYLVLSYLEEMRLCHLMYSGFSFKWFSGIIDFAYYSLLDLETQLFFVVERLTCYLLV